MVTDGNYGDAYAIYYKRHPTFHEDKTITRDQVIDPRGSFQYVGTVKYPVGEVRKSGFNINDYIYMKHQGEFIDKKTADWIRKSGLKHTSMSVGDMLMNLRTYVMYQCVDEGWEKVPIKRRKK